MQNNQAIKARQVNRLILVTGVLILFIYLLLSLLSPGHTRTRLQQSCLTDDTIPGGAGDRAIIDPALAELARREAFLNSRIIIAESDSIGLCLDLKDSLVTIEINGVVIHRAVIRDFHADPFLNTMSDDLYHCLFTVPLFIQNARSTIVKEPVIVRKAPRDTLEAANFFLQPDTIFRGPQSVVYKLSHGIRLELVEYPSGEGGSKVIGRLTDRIRSAIRQSSLNFYSMIQFSIPVYRPEIRISLPAPDIVSIYRALPEKASIAICY